MYETTVLGLPECIAALRAMLNSAPARDQGGMAIAIVDVYGETMAFARMDGASPAVRDFALKKAYTSARTGAHLKDFRAGLEQRGRTVSDFGDPNFVGMAAGGVVIADPAGTGILGAIGVSGGSPDQDEEIARFGLETVLAHLERAEPCPSDRLSVWTKRWTQLTQSSRNRKSVPAGR